MSLSKVCKNKKLAQYERLLHPLKQTANSQTDVDRSKRRRFVVVFFVLELFDFPSVWRRLRSKVKIMLVDRL